MNHQCPGCGKVVRSTKYRSFNMPTHKKCGGKPSQFLDPAHYLPPGEMNKAKSQKLGQRQQAGMRELTKE